MKYMLQIDLKINSILRKKNVIIAGRRLSYYLEFAFYYPFLTWEGTISDMLSSFIGNVVILGHCTLSANILRHEE